MLRGLARHHAGSHGVAHAPLRRCFCIDFTDSRVVGKTEVVVDAPHKKLFSPKVMRFDFSLQLGEGEVTVAVAGVLTKGPRSDGFDQNVQKSRDLEGCECTQTPKLCRTSMGTREMFTHFSPSVRACFVISTPMKFPPFGPWPWCLFGLLVDPVLGLQQNAQVRQLGGEAELRRGGLGFGQLLPGPPLYDELMRLTRGTERARRPLEPRNDPRLHQRLLPKSLLLPVLRQDVSQRRACRKGHVPRCTVLLLPVSESTWTKPTRERPSTSCSCSWIATLRAHCETAPKT